jgi:hypothetical protein
VPASAANSARPTARGAGPAAQVRRDPDDRPEQQREPDAQGGGDAVARCRYAGGVVGGEVEHGGRADGEPAEPHDAGEPALAASLGPDQGRERQPADRQHQAEVRGAAHGCRHHGGDDRIAHRGAGNGDGDRQRAGTEGGHQQHLRQRRVVARGGGWGVA